MKHLLRFFFQTTKKKSIENNNIILWLEINKPRVYKAFKKYAFKSYLYDHNRNIYSQDYTMLVGIISGFFYSYNIHGLSYQSEDAMKKAFFKIDKEILKSTDTAN